MEEEIKETSENIDNNEIENNDVLETEEDDINNEIDNYKKRIEELENEVSDMKNKYMYAMAEAENIRKRTTKDKIDSVKRANKNLLLSLLTFMDSFEGALKAYEQNTDIQNSEYYNGIKLIHKQFIDFMHDNGVSEIESLGEEFDPNVHEALTMMEIDDIDKEKVIEVYAKGYKLNDELLRTAKVVVGKPAKPE